jgi:hypothetical protein
MNEIDWMPPFSASQLATIVENVTKNNVLFDNLKDKGLIVDAKEGDVDQDRECEDCGHDVDDCICVDDEPDYLAAIHRVIEGRSS